MVVSDIGIAMQFELLKMFFGFLFILLIFAIMLSIIFSVSKSKRYRKFLADMFVAGRIKQLAEDKGIDISEECEEFKRFLKKQRLDCQDLDNVVEEELKEEIGDEILTDLDLKEIKKSDEQ